MDTTHLQAIQDASLKIKEGEVKIKMTKSRHGDKLPNVLKDQYANDNPFRVCCCPRNPSQVTGTWSEFVEKQRQLLNPVLGDGSSTGPYEMVSLTKTSAVELPAIAVVISESENEQPCGWKSALNAVNINLNRRKSLSAVSLKDRRLLDENSGKILKRVFVILILV